MPRMLHARPPALEEATINVPIMKQQEQREQQEQPLDRSSKSSSSTNGSSTNSVATTRKNMQRTNDHHIKKDKAEQHKTNNHKTTQNKTKRNSKQTNKRTSKQSNTRNKTRQDKTNQPTNQPTNFSEVGRHPGPPWSEAGEPRAHKNRRCHKSRACCGCTVDAFCRMIVSVWRWRLFVNQPVEPCSYLLRLRGHAHTCCACAAMFILAALARLCP